MQHVLIIKVSSQLVSGEAKTEILSYQRCAIDWATNENVFWWRAFNFGYIFRFRRLATYSYDRWYDHCPFVVSWNMWYRFQLYLINHKKILCCIFALLQLLSRRSFSATRFFAVFFFGNFLRKMEQRFLWMNCIHTCCRGETVIKLKEKKQFMQRKKQQKNMQNSENLSLISKCHSWEKSRMSTREAEYTQWIQSEWASAKNAKIAFHREMINNLNLTNDPSSKCNSWV